MITPYEITNLPAKERAAAWRAFDTQEAVRCLRGADPVRLNSLTVRAVALAASGRRFPILNTVGVIDGRLPSTDARRLHYTQAWAPGGERDEGCRGGSCPVAPSVLAGANDRGHAAATAEPS